MYEEFFRFSGSPFRLAPDPKFFFGSKSHNKAMAYLHYGLRQAEGFIVITGEIGAGKSMLIGHLLDQLDRSNVIAANLATPNLSPDDLLAHILSAFRIEPAGKGKAAEIEAFEDFLFDQMNHGRRVLLIVDEAQNLPVKTLEELRVLSNLEYEGTPLFQVFLIGQPDFRDVMARGDMEQLRQRVIATYHLDTMARAETEKYVEHRLRCVGWEGDPSISADAYDAIHAATGGLPRKIHKLCNRALLFLAVEGRRALTAADVNAVLADIAKEQSAAGDADEAPAANLAVPAAPVAAAQATEVPAMPRIAIASMNDGTPAFRVHTVRPIRVEPTVDLHAPSNLAASAAQKPPATGASPILDASVAAGAVAAPASLSVFDRLRARMQSSGAAVVDVEGEGELLETESGASSPPRPATLDDVANAIAAARPTRAISSPPPAEAETGDLLTEEEAAEPPPLAMAEGWRKSAVQSISDTRDELKRAHQSVVRLRKQLTEIDRRRSQRREKIAASLDRAESLLSEFQNAWR